MFVPERSKYLAFSTPGTPYAMGTPQQRFGLQKLVSERCGMRSYERLAESATKSGPIDLDLSSLPSRHYARTIFAPEEFTATNHPVKATVLSLGRHGMDGRALVFLWSPNVKAYADQNDPSTFPGNYGLTAPFAMPAAERLGGWSGVLVLAKNEHPRRMAFTDSGAQAMACLPLLPPDSLGGSLGDASKCLDVSRDAMRSQIERQGRDMPAVLYARDLKESSWVLSMVLRQAAGHYGSGESNWPCGIVDLFVDDVTRHNSVLLIARVLVEEYRDFSVGKPSSARIDAVGVELGINEFGKPWTRSTAPHPRKERSLTLEEVGLAN